MRRRKKRRKRKTKTKRKNTSIDQKSLGPPKVFFVMAQTDRQTDTQTDGHGNSLAVPASSVKIQKEFKRSFKSLRDNFKVPQGNFLIQV